MVETQRPPAAPAGRPAASSPGVHPGGHPGGNPGGHPGALPGVGAVKPRGLVYDRAPMLVYWETTLACGLACRHCRATAEPERSPLELTTDEGRALLDRIVGFGEPLPHVVFTGGDPLRRPDLEELVVAATERGIGASLAPAVTPDFTLDRLRSLKAAGIQTISLSLDGSDAGAPRRPPRRRRDVRHDDAGGRVGQRGRPADPGQHPRHRHDARRPARRPTRR